MILVQVEALKDEDEPVERCGDGRGGEDSVSDGGCLVTDVYSAVEGCIMLGSLTEDGLSFK